MQSSTDPLQRMRLHQGLSNYMSTGIRIGTACSGVNVVQVVTNALREAWESEFNRPPPTITYMFHCDSAEGPQEFIKQEWEPDVVFKDIGDLKHETAECIIQKKAVRVKPLDIFIAGFSCKGPSGLNSQRGKKKHSCQTGEGETGETWTGVEAFLRAHRPSIVLLENVKQLANAPRDSNGNISGLSDSAHILQSLSEMGYCARSPKLEALDYGSLTKRERLYFIGFNVPGKDNEAIADAFFSGLESYKIPRQHIDAVLGPVADIPLPSDKAIIDEFHSQHTFKGDLLDTFMKIPGLKYPPDLTSFSADFRAALHGLSVRQIELVVLLEETEPWHAEKETAEFVDINLSEAYILGPDGHRRAFRPWVPVLATKSVVFMRYLAHDGQKTWRQIKGNHLLRLIGYGDPLHVHAAGVLKVLAGNAFNGYAIGAILSSIIAAVGASSTPPAADAHAEPPGPS